MGTAVFLEPLETSVGSSPGSAHGGPEDHQGA